LACSAVELEEPARDGLAQLVNQKFKGDFTFLWASPAATKSRRCRNGYVAALKPDWSHWKGDAASWRRTFEFARALYTDVSGWTRAAQGKIRQCNIRVGSHHPRPTSRPLTQRCHVALRRSPKRLTGREQTP